MSSTANSTRIVTHRQHGQMQDSGSLQLQPPLPPKQLEKEDKKKTSSIQNLIAQLIDPLAFTDAETKNEKKKKKGI